MGYVLHIPKRVLPTLIEKTLSNEVLGWLQKLSEPYGTKIDIKDGIGTITI